MDFLTLNADGKDWKTLDEINDQHAYGSVTVSPDGKTIAFDSWIGAKQGGSAAESQNLHHSG